MTLKKIISGGQTGADQAGLAVGKAFGLETGGLMPLGFKTLSGNRPEFAAKYGVTEHSSPQYAPRTACNVQAANGTVRFAADFKSRGEICTMNAIKKHNNVFFDVDLTDPPPVADFINWIKDNKIETLNVAGNAEQTYDGCFRKTVSYLSMALFEMGHMMTITTEIVLSTFFLSDDIAMYHKGFLMEEFQLGKKSELLSNDLAIALE